MATPTNVPVDSFEAVCNAGLELEVGAAKAVGLVLEPVTRITVPRPDEDVVPVGGVGVRRQHSQAIGNALLRLEDERVIPAVPDRFGQGD